MCLIFLTFEIILVFEQCNYHFQLQFCSHKDIWKQNCNFQPRSLLKSVKYSSFPFKFWIYCKFGAESSMKQNICSYIKVCISSTFWSLLGSWLLHTGPVGICGATESSQRCVTKFTFWLFTYSVTRWLWPKDLFMATTIFISVDICFSQILIIQYGHFKMWINLCWEG